MIHRPAARAARADAVVIRWGALTLALIMLLGFATVIRAEEKIIKSHGFSEFGELKYPEGFAHFDYVNPDAPKGGEYSYAAQGTFDSFNPFTRQGRAADRAADQYETLLFPSYDEPASYYGLVAESLEYPESQAWVIFNLRPEARFSDGTPVTAEDVVFSHNILLDQGLQSYAEAVRKRIPKAEVLDPHRVKFYFAEDYPRRAMISQVGGTPIFSKAWFDADPENRRLDKPRMEPGIGSAPYVLDSYDINRRVVYKRNPDYWGDAINVNVGRNNYDTIRIEYFSDSIAAMEAFKAGEITLRQENNSKNWATSYDFPALTAGHVVKEELLDGNVPSATGFVMNINRPQFADPRVREAVQLAFNFEWTNESLQYGLFQQRDSFWEGTHLEATGLPEGRELEILLSLGEDLDPAVLTAEPVSAHSSKPDRQTDRGNLRKAMGLLDQAGWTVGDDGVRRNAQGRTLRIEFLSDDPVLDRIAMPFVDNLKTMGIDASYNRIDNAQFTLRRRERDFDMISGGYRTSLQPSTGLYQQYGTEAAAFSVFNPSGIHGPDIEALIDNIVEARESDELTANVRALDRVLRAKRFMVPTWFLGKYWVAYWDKYEYPQNLPPYALGVEDLWWINADKAAALKSSGALR
ncbi:extracellular solute-binding protein [Sedimentitalea nanhaiensis]|uniref:Microcin C transport system substrate-binding protein n=1 Tax=Sedimentitalea nanhaiensis TaxID=999627 RepID=A0A1I7CV45_9RHOB|nr:extracellular solute-binding protein [Sedimentitalea nanhaiensis]SFU03280.1 microcin C transport system substrate-binding protein [Sedimentitalea nanhaiensis]